MQFFNSFDELAMGHSDGLVSDMATFNLDISYANETLKSQCTQGTPENLRLSRKNRIKLAERLPAIAGAHVLEDLRHADGRFHELRGDRRRQIACELDGVDRLVFESDSGTFWVHAESRDEARQMVEENCSQRSCSQMHSTLPSDQVSWRFPRKPQISTGRVFLQKQSD